jgi:urease accessory protein
MPKISKRFLEVFLKQVICCSEAPLVIYAYESAKNWNDEQLDELNQLSLAMKLTKESREASVKTGKAMLRVGKEMLNDKEIDGFYEDHKETGIHFSVAFGMIAAKMSIDIEETIAAYVFSSINALIQSGVKLIPLGNIEAQMLFLKLNQRLAEAVDESFTVGPDELNNFTPGFDLASIEHEELPTRIYMS